MPDVVDEFGLQVATQDELRAKNAADVRAAPEFSADADVSVDTVFGSLFEPVISQFYAASPTPTIPTTRKG
jgi:hypothetical protein